jgi:hypothetical protein
VSTGDHDKPRRRRLNVTEEALGENEMFRVKRRMVSLPLDGASEDDLREFAEHVQNNEQTEIPFLLRLVSDLTKIEAELDELKYPPPRGWVLVREDHSWGPLPEDASARMAADYGTMVEWHNPNTGLPIETGANYIKRRTKTESLPWWLGHLGNLIVRILDEPDPDKERARILYYGREKQRYLDQHGHLAGVRHGRNFRSRPTESATEEHEAKAKKRRDLLIRMARAILANGGGTFESGGINVTSLAETCARTVMCPVGFERAKDLLADAIRLGKLG